MLIFVRYSAQIFHYKVLGSNFFLPHSVKAMLLLIDCKDHMLLSTSLPSLKGKGDDKVCVIYNE